MPQFDTVAIVGAPGPKGLHLTQELLERGVGGPCRFSQVREAEQGFWREQRRSRDGGRCGRSEPAHRCGEGDCIVDCMGLPPDSMHLDPTTEEAVADAAAAIHSRIVHVSSICWYLPAQRLPL